MWSKSKSLALSYLITIVLFFVLIAVAIFLPGLISDYLYLYHKNQSLYHALLGMFYSSLIPAFCAIFSLYRLLRNISKNIIFDCSNVTLLRILSWCCFLVTGIFFIFGFMYTFCLILAFAAIFFGLILRVIKNVFEKAIELKEENEYTI